jgi:hypothetical protein
MVEPTDIHMHLHNVIQIHIKKCYSINLEEE